MKKQCFHVSSIVNKVSQLIRAKKNKKKTIQKSKRRKDDEKKKKKHLKVPRRLILLYKLGWKHNFIHPDKL